MFCPVSHKYYSMFKTNCEDCGSSLVEKWEGCNKCYFFIPGLGGHDPLFNRCRIGWDYLKCKFFCRSEKEYLERQKDVKTYAETCETCMYATRIKNCSYELLCHEYKCPVPLKGYCKKYN